MSTTEDTKRDLRTVYIRAMANALHDHGVNPLDTDAICITLLRVGFLSKDIALVYDDVVTMAMVRLENEKESNIDRLFSSKGTKGAEAARSNVICWRHRRVWPLDIR